MLIYLKNISLLHVLTIFIACITQIKSIYQTCGSNTDCPVNSFCGYKNYCICDDGFIMNCSTSSQTLSNNPVTAAISQTETYYTISPQNLYEYIKFTIKLSTTESTETSVTVNLWGQTGYLTDLTNNNKMQTMNIEVSSNEPATIDTTYFEFGLQPNGQPQVLYMGILLSSTPPPNIPMSISMQQFPAYNENVFKIILTVLMAILSVACFVLLAFCIYRRRRMDQMRQRAQQQKEIKSTAHFDQYMPRVPAGRVNAPLQVCSVCLNDITLDNEVRLTICKHLFHGECIDSWCKKNNSCPICRQQLDLQSCQKILGEDFDLTESLSGRKVSKMSKNEVEMMERPTNKNNVSNLNEEEIVEENSIRRAIL